MKRLSVSIGILVFAALFTMRCSPPPVVVPGQEPGNQPAGTSSNPAPAAVEPPSGSGAMQTAEATVDSVEVQILESFPVQVHVVVSGYLPDGCTRLDEVTTEQNGNEFVVTITTKRPADAICTQALVPYEEVVPLDVAGLPAGEYTVTVNGVMTSFELAMDNG